MESASEELASIEEEARVLETAGDVPTPDAIAAARKHRDAGWLLVRGRYVDEPATVDETEIREFSAGVPLPEAFEASLTAADNLADRKEAEAARIAADANLRQRRERAGRRCDEQLAKGQQTREVLAGLESEWDAAWRPSGITPLSPREMIGWNVQRERVLDLLRAERRATAALGRVGENVRTATASLAETLDPIATAGASLATLIARTRSRIEEQRDLAGRRERLRAREAELASDYHERQRVTGTTETRIDQWQDAWAVATRALGQPSDQKPDATAAVLELFEELDAACRDLASGRGRLTAMRRDEDRFSAAVSALEQRSGLALQETDALAVYDKLARVLQEMKTTAARRQTLVDEVTPVAGEMAAAVADLSEAKHALAALRQEASADSDADLADIHSRAQEQTTLLTGIAALRSELDDVSDGLSLDHLMRDVAASSPDDDRSSIAIAQERLDQINQKFHDLGGKRTELEHRRSAIETGGDTELHAADLERARAELRDIGEEYALRRAAAGLLARAIDVVREERQGPILAEASDLFATITEHSFERLAIDFDRSDNPTLMGARPSGERVSVAGMSDGTRDQLFLSLRLALVQRYIADASPLPFIADDLLVNFDDARARATLRALATLSKDTQVIFFTHHVHLAELAKATLSKEEFVLHEIYSG